jgi:hypothetical protein
MEQNHLTKLEQHERDITLANHRLNVLEQEQLPRRVASLEPVVQRLENKMDSLGDTVTEGFEEVKAALLTQKTMQKTVAAVVIFLVGLVQFLPYLKGLMP